MFRARLILSLAEGLSYREIERTLGASAPTVSKWKTRFEQSGMAGLQGQHKGSQPRAATPAVQARILRRAQQKPADGSTHWSCRKLATALGLSKTTVQRVLAQAKRKRTVKAVLTRSSYLEVGQALIAETVANIGQEELAF